MENKGLNSKRYTFNFMNIQDRKLLYTYIGFLAGIFMGTTYFNDDLYLIFFVGCLCALLGYIISNM